MSWNMKILDITIISEEEELGTQGEEDDTVPHGVLQDPKVVL